RHILGQSSLPHSPREPARCRDSLGKHEYAFLDLAHSVGDRLSRRQSRAALSGRALCRCLGGWAISFYLLRESIARHHHEPEFIRLNSRMARKNLMALLIYIAAIVVAFIYTPLALIMIALPAAMYFLPDRGLGFFVR